MRTLLAVVGVESYPALVTAEYKSLPADPEFPTARFNHVILCVPNGRDSIWLECTSNTNKAGFLGNFTENKNALLLTETGGKLVRTPASASANNQLVTRTDIALDDQGGAQILTRLYTTGELFGLFHE